MLIPPLYQRRDRSNKPKHPRQTLLRALASIHQPHLSQGLTPIRQRKLNLKPERNHHPTLVQTPQMCHKATRNPVSAQLNNQILKSLSHEPLPYDICHQRGLPWRRTLHSNRCYIHKCEPQHCRGSQVGCLLLFSCTPLQKLESRVEQMHLC